MLAKWARDSRVHLLIILMAYAVLAAVVQVQCADLLSSDGENYLRMAVYYVKGDWDHAIFGHWSPLGAWMTVPLVAAGMAPRYAFRLMIGLWGALAVAGTWRLAGRFGMGVWLRAAATVCAAALAVEFSADHRVDLLLTGLLLFYLDATMDERLLEPRGWAHLAGVLAGMAYLAKLYALPFFVAHFTLVVLVRGIVSVGTRQSAVGNGQEASATGQSAIGNRQSGISPAGIARRLFWMGRAWLSGLVGFALIAAPWVGVLSAKLGRLTVGTAGATTYAHYGPGSGDARRQAITGLRRPPAGAYSVWQDATLAAAVPERRGLSPLASRDALARQVAFAGRNARLIAGHLASLDEFHLGLASLGLTPLAFVVVVWRRRQSALRYVVVALAVVVFCGGYAFVFAEDRRFFWFAMLVLAVLAFHFADALPRGLGRWLGARAGRLLAAAACAVLVVSFAFHPVRFLSVLLHEPPPGREHRLVAARLAEWGARGPLASIGQRAWWDGLHTAYYLDASYAGTPKAEHPPAIVAEMREAGAATLLVWGEPQRAEALAAESELEVVGAIPAGSLAGLRRDVAVLRLR